jgi:polyferredoxin
VLLVVRYSVFFVGILLSVLIGVTLITFYLSRGDIYRPICQVCPAYPLFTLSQAGLGLTTAAGARQIPWLSLGILAAFMVASIRVRRPFCRVCPVSVVMMPFSKVSGVSLHKDPKKCTRCSMCHRVCPVDVTEVWKEMERTDVTVPECILCMRCVEACPEDGCLTGRVLGINVTESSYAKFLNSHKRSVRERVVSARRDRGSDGGGG